MIVRSRPRTKVGEKAQLAVAADQFSFPLRNVQLRVDTESSSPGWMLDDISAAPAVRPRLSTRCRRLKTQPVQLFQRTAGTQQTAKRQTTIFGKFGVEHIPGHTSFCEAGAALRAHRRRQWCDVRHFQHAAQTFARRLLWSTISKWSRLFVDWVKLAFFVHGIETVLSLWEAFWS